MGYFKRIVCLANSRKHAGRCIAGKELLSQGYGSWIRPVSTRPGAEVSEEERRYQDGSQPRLLDIIDVPLLRASPSDFQTENHIIDSGFCWSANGYLRWSETPELLDTPEGLWPNGNSSYSGLNDRVTLDVARNSDYSLLLIEPTDTQILVTTEGEELGNPRIRVRASFRYAGVSYRLAVTDPIIERSFLARGEGVYPLTRTFLTVSLGEPHSDGNCYKLVAAVISAYRMRGRP